jgi:hypothetical protein
LAGEHEQAVEAFGKVPRAALGLEEHVYRALAYAQLGRKAEVAQAVVEVLREDPGFSAEAWVDGDFFQPGGSSAALFFDGAQGRAADLRHGGGGGRLRAREPAARM